MVSKSKAEILQTFNPSGVGLNNGNLFGFPFDYASADVIIFGVPWDVTTSYQPGTAQGPEAILQASPQLDFYDLDYPEAWKQGIFMPPIPEAIATENQRWRSIADTLIAYQEQGHSLETAPPDLQQSLAGINQACQKLNQWVFEQTQTALNQDKKVGIIGGDHSVPLGYLQALGDRYSSFGILQIDAHADLRIAYEGFEFSHASIMHNALKLPQVSRLVQVGVRDICPAEVAVIAQSNSRIITHYDARLKQQIYAGTSWLSLCQQIVADLPPQVYISFDVDGLDPKLCPQTGTPVPGGLELEAVFCLFKELIHRGHQIIGFDVCEVGNGAWDGNVGARIVYKLYNLLNPADPKS